MSDGSHDLLPEDFCQMTPPYEIKKNLLGQYVVHYGCPKCGERLKSAMTDSGNADSCPVCQARFVVPGSHERERMFTEQEAARIQKEERQREKEIAAEELRRQQFADLTQLEQEQAELAEAIQQCEQECQHEQQNRFPPTERRCPFCAEQVQPTAIKCKHCGEFIDGRQSPSPAVEQFRHPSAQSAQVNPPQKAITNGLAACLAVLLIAVCCGIPMCSEMGGRKSSSTPRGSRQSGRDSSSTHAREWYEGGTLHQKSGLEWQTASYGDKLATCGDLVTKMWQDGNLKSSIAAGISSVDDVRPLAQELVTFLDNSFKGDPDPEQNRVLLTNQTVAETAAIGMVMMGWTK